MCSVMTYISQSLGLGKLGPRGVPPATEEDKISSICSIYIYFIFHTIVSALSKIGPKTPDSVESLLMSSY